MMSWTKLNMWSNALIFNRFYNVTDYNSIWLFSYLCRYIFVNLLEMFTTINVVMPMCSIEYTNGVYEHAGYVAGVE